MRMVRVSSTTVTRMRKVVVNKGTNRGCYCAVYRAYGFLRLNGQDLDHTHSVDDIRPDMLGNVYAHSRKALRCRRICHSGVSAKPY